MEKAKYFFLKQLSPKVVFTIDYFATWLKRKITVEL